MTSTPTLAEVKLSNFDQEVLRSPQPVLVEFWAEWCSSCKAMAPLLMSLAGEQQGALKVVRVNVELNETLAGRYLVRAVPTLLIFQDGAVRDQIAGRTTELELREMLERYL